MPVNPQRKPTAAEQAVVFTRLINWGYVAMLLLGIIIGFAVGYVV
jgi:hypothetical protein